MTIKPPLHRYSTVLNGAAVTVLYDHIGPCVYVVGAELYGVPIEASEWGHHITAKWRREIEASARELQGATQ